MAYKGNAYGGPVATITFDSPHKFNNAAGKQRYTSACVHNFRLDQDMKSQAEAMEKDAHIDWSRTHYNKILIDDRHYSPVTPDGKPLLTEDGEPVEGGYDFVKSVQDKFDEIQEREAEYNKENGIPYGKRKFRVKNDPNNTKASSVSSIAVAVGLTDGFQRLPGWEDGFDFEAWARGEKKEGAFDLDKWVEDSMNYLKETFGENNITHAVLHMDEYSPHIHAMITPITNDGRLSARDWDLWKPVEMSKRHQQYYEAVKQPGIQRPVPGLTYAFHGKDAQIEAQAALTLENDIEILPPVQEKESAEEYKKRADSNARIFAKQKYLEVETLRRKNEIEQRTLQDQITASEQRAEEAENKAKKEAEKTAEYRVKYMQEKHDKEFYEKQLSGSGVTRKQLQDTASLTQGLEAQHAQEVRALTIKQAKTQERLREALEENSTLQTKLNTSEAENERLRTVINANGITNGMLLNHKNMEYIKYGLQNMPGDRAEAFKKEMLYWLKTGKNVKDIEQTKDPIIE